MPTMSTIGASTAGSESHWMCGWPAAESAATPRIVAAQSSAKPAGGGLPEGGGRFHGRIPFKKQPTPQRPRRRRLTSTAPPTASRAPLRRPPHEHGTADRLTSTAPPVERCCKGVPTRHVLSVTLGG